MAKILDLYDGQKAALGVDKISFEAGVKAKTPYTTNDLKDIDTKVLNAEKFKVGRTGELKSDKYSDKMKK